MGCRFQHSAVTLNPPLLRNHACGGRSNRTTIGKDRDQSTQRRHGCPMMRDGDEDLRGCAARTGQPASAPPPSRPYLALGCDAVSPKLSPLTEVSSLLCAPGDISTLRRHDTAV